MNTTELTTKEKTDDQKFKASHIPRSLDKIYFTTERTSSASYRATNSAKKKEVPIIEPDNQTGLLSALEYIASPVKYFTSVFINPVVEAPKSPPKPRYTYPEHPKSSPRSKSQPIPKPIPTSRLSLNDIEARSSSMDTFEVIRGDLTDHIKVNEKILPQKPTTKTTESKKYETKKPSPRVVKTSFKPKSAAKKQQNSFTKKPVASFHNVEIIPPRILSASNVRIASSANFSFRITSAEKVEAASPKQRKAPKKVFKIDREKNPYL